MNFSDLPLEEILTHLASRRATGTLTVTTPRTVKKLILIDGQLAGVSSSNPRELIGHFLLGWGLITEEQLAEALRIQERLATPLGRILERMGAVDAGDLEQAVRAQAEEALLELFLVPAVQERFLENVVPVERPVSLRLPVPPLVMEGLRRRWRLTELHDTLGDLDTVPRRTSQAPPEGLSGRELHILAEIDGEHDIEAVALACHVVPFHVAEFVARGVKEGFLEVTGRPAVPSVGPGPEMLASARAALEEGELRRCWDLLERLRHSESAAATHTECEFLQDGIARALAERRIAGHLVPVLAESPTGEPPAPLRPAEAFVLSRVNQRWSLREIQRITPVDEIEFGIIVDTLSREGLIELRHPEGRSST